MTKYFYLYNSLIDLVANKPDFGAYEHQRRRPSCASALSGQHLCYSPLVIFMAILATWADREEGVTGVPDWKITSCYMFPLKYWYGHPSKSNRTPRVQLLLEGGS